MHDSFDDFFVPPPPVCMDTPPPPPLTPTFRFIWYLFMSRPDMTFAVNWALNNNHRSIYLVYAYACVLENGDQVLLLIFVIQKIQA